MLVQRDETVYKAECDVPGFAANFVLDPTQKRTSYQQFQKLGYKWQSKLGRIFKLCLDSGEYLKVRNALLVLNKVIKVRCFGYCHTLNFIHHRIGL